MLFKDVNHPDTLCPKRDLKYEKQLLKIGQMIAYFRKSVYISQKIHPKNMLIFLILPLSTLFQSK